MTHTHSHSKPAADWYGATLDIVIILALTLLTALHIASLAVFLAVTGPIVGARLAVVRKLRQGVVIGGALGVLAGLSLLVRRPGA